MNKLPLYIAPILLTLSGCGSSSDIREYEVAREDEKVLTSDLLRDQFEAVPFRWEVPKDWVAAQNDQFSAFAWTAGPSESSARITVSDLPDRKSVV